MMSCCTDDVLAQHNAEDIRSVSTLQHLLSKSAVYPERLFFQTVRRAFELGRGELTWYSVAERTCGQEQCMTGRQSAPLPQ